MNLHECEAGYLLHALRVKQVNRTAWRQSSVPHTALRERLGSLLIALGTSIAPTPQPTAPHPMMASTPTPA
jgi:hypothetical protein